MNSIYKIIFLLLQFVSSYYLKALFSIYDKIDFEITCYKEAKSDILTSYVNFKMKSQRDISLFNKYSRDLRKRIYF